MMDDLMQMARQAGAHDDGFEVRFKEPRYLERFAALVIAITVVKRLVDITYQMK